MGTLKRVSWVFNSADEIIFDDESKIILMSDCHRGDGNWSDDFARNQNIYFAALNHYYKEGFTYIEIGDGDELWEHRSFHTILNTHKNIFWLLSKFYTEGRLHLIYGNHDIVKKNDKYVKRNLYKYFDERRKKYVPLFENIKIHEGIVLKHRDTGNKILLIHGHQADFLNYNLWRISRFMVRYLWRPLELWGVNNPTRTAKNYVKKESVGRKLSRWVKKEKHMMIAGHTHLYFQSLEWMRRILMMEAWCIQGV